MKQISQEYKNGIKTLGKEIAYKVLYTIDEEETVLDNESINSSSLAYEGSLLKSVMKKLEFDTPEEIPLETEVEYHFGLKVDNENNVYEWINYGNFIVYSVEKHEDTNSYVYTCYDKMLYAMKDYESLEVEYPITIKEYLSALCTKIDLTLKDSDFVNQDKEIQNELYLDANGNSLNYTFRDVLDEIAGVTASTICINEDDEVEVRYVQNVGEYSTSSGTKISIPNVDDGKDINITLEGDTYQETTTGKNLYDDIYSDYTQPLDYRICPITLEQGQTYTLKSTLIGTKVTGIIVGIVPYGEKYQDFSSKLLISVASGGGATTKTFTPDATWTSPKLAIYASNEATFNSIFENYQVQLEKGNSATDYEPYTNGATPRPDYPQDIQSVSGKQEILIEGKNLFSGDYSQFTNTGGTGTTYDYFKLPNDNKQYTLTVIAKNDFTTTFNTFLGLSANGGNSGGAGVSWVISQSSGTITKGTILSKTSTIDLRYVSLYSKGANSLKNFTDNFYIQLEEGSTATDFTPYIEPKEYEIDLSSKNLLSNNFKDYNITSGTYGFIKITEESEDLRLSLFDKDTSVSISGVYLGFTGNGINANSGVTWALSGGSTATDTSIGNTVSKYKYISFYPKNEATFNKIFSRFNVQVERGTTATEYEEYYNYSMNRINDNKDKIKKSTGKNLFDNNISNLNCNIVNGMIVPNTTSTDFYIKGASTYSEANKFLTLESGSYYIKTTNSNIRITMYGDNGNLDTASNQPVTLSSTINFGGIRVRSLNSTSLQNIPFGIIISKTDSEYEPYGTGWYLKKEIGKVVLDGSETWSLVGSLSNGYYTNSLNGINPVSGTTNIYTVCNYYVSTNRSGIDNYDYSIGLVNNGSSTGFGNFIIKNKDIATSYNLQTWLSNNNTIVYYALATPTYKVITNQKLIDQLNVIELLEGVNEITVDSENLSSPIEITYLSQRDTIDEEYLKDINVNFGEKYGPVNSIVLSRSAGADNIYRADEQSIEDNGLCEIKISDNQILNSNNRDEFIDGIFNKLNGFEYYINDFSSTGITYYDLCDRYNVSIGDKVYTCVMFNDEINVNQGLEELVYTERPEDSETDYKKADKTDRKINQTYLIVDKQNQQIDAVIKTINEHQVLIDENGEQIDALGTRLTQTTNNISASITSLQDELDSGVGLVKTTTVTIDDNGLNVSTDNSKIATTMTNEAFQIVPKGSTEPLAFFGYDNETNSTKAVMDNLTVTNYFVSGYHRTEKMTINGENRTGQFFIG